MTVAQTKLEEMGFGVPLQFSGPLRGLPGNWKKHAARVIAYIDGYGIEATREAIARAQAKARTELGEPDPPA